eukprot:m.102292 g.102292  ORF g.102292 m.102292 type:complete len:106 (-) comp51536_c0_seq3:282-599(-)
MRALWRSRWRHHRRLKAVVGHSTPIGKIAARDRSSSLLATDRLGCTLPFFLGTTSFSAVAMVTGRSALQKREGLGIPTVRVDSTALLSYSGRSPLCCTLQGTAAP